MTWKWMPSFQVACQTCHVLAGWLIVAQLRHWGAAWWVPPPVVLAWVLVKEFGFDLIVERDTLADSENDAFWYAFGAILGICCNG